MTLIEVAAVIVIVALLGTLFSERFNLIAPLKTRSELRTLAATIETVAASARDTDTALRLVIDREHNSYFVRSEILPEMVDGSQTKKQSSSVLSSFKTKSEIARQQKADNAKVLSVEEQLELQDKREGAGLEQLFYDQVLQDTGEDALLGEAADLPSLSREQFMSPTLQISAIEGIDRNEDSRISIIRFIGRRYAPYFRMIITEGDSEQILSFDPLSGKVYFGADAPFREETPELARQQ
jgi:hypothetical protein